MTTEEQENARIKYNWMNTYIQSLLRSKSTDFDDLNPRNTIDNPLCHLLSGKSILFVGDSLNRFQALSLYYLMGGMGRKCRADFMQTYNDLKKLVRNRSLAKGNMLGGEVCQAYTTFYNQKKMYIQAQTETWSPRDIQRTFERIYSDLDKDDFHIIVHNFAAHGHRLGIDPASFQDTYINGIIPKAKQLILHLNGLYCTQMLIKFFLFIQR